MPEPAAVSLAVPPALPPADRLQRAFAAEIAAAVAKYPAGRQASAVLDLLYLAQSAYGRITTESIEEVANLLEMDPTQVRGVVGFYSLFKEEPHGRMVVHYCTDLPCALRGAEAFLPRVCRAFGVAKAGETSPDGLFSVEEAMCLAACDRAPMMQVNLSYFHDLTDERLDAIVADLRARAASGGSIGPPFGFGSVRDVAAAHEANEAHGTP
ncbi:MAG: NAD(P)H-dependent oxidoreductase subunit E [Ardenticatenales bacterium]|jgi:NADH-quinone oxidoreductase subunit E|nr:NAD(P)H-dependent oxidoreductase subunit E [Ardenticatenales bacterium]